MPDVAHIIFLIPIVAIAFGCTVVIVKCISNHFIELARIRQSKVVSVDNAGLEALRNEVMKLRDTTTQYDMSVERTLSEIKNRLAHVESQVGVQSIQTAKTEPEPPQNAQREYVPITSTESNSELQQVTLGRNE
jgi:hypothetical protein